MPTRCISCGKCVKNCPQNAKIVIDNKTDALNILRSSSKVIACLAPSFITSFYPNHCGKVIGALKKLGFSEVWEVALGAEELTKQIETFISINDKKTYITSACPAFVTLIEKHYPEFLEYLLPFASPMIATARIIKEKYKNQDIKIIFIGPCIAKKAEAAEPQFKNLIDVVLTFEELKELFVDEKIEIHTSNEESFEGPSCQNGRLFALPSGLTNNLLSFDITDEDKYISVHGERECLELLDYLSRQKAPAKFIDVLLCNGCIEGPIISSTQNYHEKIHITYDFYENRSHEKYSLDTKVDLHRTFKNRRTILPLPSEEEIQRVLQMTDKFTKEDELNCGACGYSTCRNKAIAVIHGIAEVDMCLPYLISKKSKLYEALNEKFNEIASLKDELEATIESSYDGIVVTDGNGKILMQNSAWINMAGLDREHIGEQVHEMENMGIIFPSATLLALKEKRRISFIQNTKIGKKFLATGTPIFGSEGNIKMVVTNIRDIDELYKLKKNIEETMQLQKYQLQENKYLSGRKFLDENIIANSLEFGKVLQTAGSVAGVNSTVLLLGESGVGKEVLAKFIHRLSKRSEKPMITINCSAIPENLIESELFGYETGAFTGAQKRGKQGLIELANEGTLFLDEIGELPLNLQVKLLRVLQDRKLMRLGGISEINVDVRIIAATNRDLYKMVIDKQFRADLYYRLNVVPIEIPPLRKRKSDILPLCHHFIDIYNHKYGINKELSLSAEQVLENYNWPGNVRELENLIERLVVTTSPNIIDADNLPNFLIENDSDINSKIRIDEIIKLNEAQELIEKILIEKAYKKYGNTYEMAEVLGVNQSTVVRKIHKYFKSNALLHD